MKKVLIFLFVIFCFASSTQAKTINVVSLNRFSTETPTPTFKVRTIEREIISKDLILESDTIISGIILKVNSTKFFKCKSSFDFIPTEITYQGVTEKINHPRIVARVVGYSPANFTELVTNIGLKAANIFLKGAISAAEFTQGAIEGDYGQKFQSGVAKVYQNSMLYYIGPGLDLNINEGDMIMLKIIKK